MAVAKRPAVSALVVAVALGSSGTADARVGGPFAKRLDDDVVHVEMPFQIGLVGYLPRVRIGVHYGRRLGRGHWLILGAAALLDRGDHRTFGEDPCGRAGLTGEGICEPGTVAGGDGQLGYVHWFHLERAPKLVPLVRVAVGGGFWKYPAASNLFQHQDRDRTWMVGGRAGTGLRGMVSPRVALGIDVNVSAGLAWHHDAPLYEHATWTSEVLLGLEALPAMEILF